MKKILCFVLAAAMALSLAACGNGSNGNASDGNTIKVGVIANTTGDSSQYGIAVSQGAKLYIKQQYCVSCAVHGRIVRARKVEDRRIREYVRPQFKGVGLRD